MKSKLFPLITLLLGVLSSAVGLILPLYIIENHASGAVDIIGGASAPTYARAVWQMDGLPVTLILLGAKCVKDLQTAAIQSAIDHCYLNGGGEVIVPEGVYITGGIRLRSNVTLHLEKNAKLLGVRDP